MTQNLKGVFSAPGKLILSGEHAVVYGFPALVAAVDKRLEINEHNLIKSEIPIGCGMGSSAAYAVALSAAKLSQPGKPIDKQKINAAAYDLEKIQHGHPSGVDNTICTYGGFLWFRKETEKFKISSPLTGIKNVPRLWICNTGKPVESTGQMVAFVRELLDHHPARINAVFKNIEIITRSFLRLLTGEEISSFPELIKENERCLENLRVVSEATKVLIRKLEKIGAAAKVSGAGGRKSASGIILIHTDNLEKVTRLLKTEKLSISSIRLGEEGVRYEEN